MTVLLAIGATVSVWHQQAEQPSSSQLQANQREKGRPESFPRESSNALPVLLKALLEMKQRATQAERSNAIAEAPNGDTPASAPVEPTPLNVDEPPVGPHADQIITAQAMSDEELSDSEAPGSAIHKLSENAAHNQEIARGEARIKEQSIGPAEVDPDSHPPTN